MERASSTASWSGRRIELEGAANFRDFGGYQTADGRYVKTGLLFRSDGLFALTDRDIQKLRDMGLKTIVDYRTPDELAPYPDREIPGARYLNLDPMAQAAALAAAGKGPDVWTLDAYSARQMMMGMNEQLVIHQPSIRVYSAMLRLAMDPGSLPMVQHCQAGKDRTGYGAALILLLLGVPRETVMEDYLLTNFFTRQRVAGILQEVRDQGGDEDKVQATGCLCTVRPEYLGRALDILFTRYGTAENYVKTAMGFSDGDIHRLRELLLEP